MAIFKYRGINKSGQEIKSTINSESNYLAKQKIKSMGIMLIDISEKKSSSSLKNKASINFINPISSDDLALMTRQLSTLIKAKIQIVEAFSALIDQTENEQMRLVLSDIRQKVNEGSTLSKALNDYPKIFNHIYVNMVDAGETSGMLSIVLEKLADFTESQLKLKNKIKSAMTYPVVMIFFGFSMMALIFIIIMPKITKVFISMKKELPLQTKICIWISDTLRNYWFLIIVAIFLLFFMFKKYINTKSGKLTWHKTLLKMPIIGNLQIMINVGRFCSTLSTLLNAGVPILTSLNIVKNLLGNIHMQHAVENAKNSVAEGASMTTPLIKSGYFPPLVTHMISIGEKSGELEPMLKIVSENYDNQVSNKLAGLTSILEPIMLLFMGGAVGFIVFSVIAPIMDMNTFAQ